MVTNNSPEARSLPSQDLLFIFLVALFLSLLGGLVQKTVVAIFWVAILAAAWYTYNQILSNSRAINRGLLVGSVLGTAVGLIGWLLGGSIEGVGSGALFGLLRGIIIGAVIGLVTRANSEADDSRQTKILIIGGSVLLGAVLSGLVGLATGILFGLIGEGVAAAVRATVLGSILGAAIGSVYKETRWLVIITTTAAILAAVSALLGGAFGGIIIGAISGSFAPILLVSSIGAFGGLTGRGLKAMVIEALEAPIEMMEQGAVPFLSPAFIIGMTIGAISAGKSGIFALAITFSFLGLFFAILGEINGSSSKMTPRSMVEMAMLGGETWPLAHIVQLVKKRPRQAAASAAIGALVALVGAAGGVSLAQLLLNLLEAG